MYCLPSSSKRYAPSPRLKNTGLLLSPRKVRTGELTPPGMWRWACWNKSCERVMRPPSMSMRPIFRPSLLYITSCSLHRIAPPVDVVRALNCSPPARRRSAIPQCADVRRCNACVAATEHAVDHREQISACGDEVRSVCGVDAADGGDRNGQRAARSPQQGRFGLPRVGFGARGKEPAEGNVIGARTCRGFGTCEFIVTGHPNEGAWTEECARLFNTTVVAAQVHAVSPEYGGERDIIVDDERHLRHTTETQQHTHKHAPLDGATVLVAILDHHRPVCECGVF